jgi:hypothetical protein
MELLESQDPYRAAFEAAAVGIGRHLTRLMHGDVLVNSTPGQGSVFTVTLPTSLSGLRSRRAAQALAASWTFSSASS